MTSALDFNIEVVLTMEVVPCAFCSRDITPDDNPKHIRIGPRKIDYKISIHGDCFEAVGWTITYFLTHYSVVEGLKH